MAKKTTRLPQHPAVNLGKYLYRSKLKNEPKISKQVAKHSKTPPTAKKLSRRKAKRMTTPKEV